MKTQTWLQLDFRTKKGKIPKEKLSRRQCDGATGIFGLFIETLKLEVCFDLGVDGQEWECKTGPSAIPLYKRTVACESLTGAGPNAAKCNQHDV